MLRFPPNVVSVLCVMQVMAIVGTCLIARTMLKVYHTAQLPTEGVRANSLYLTVKTMPYVVPWLLLVPLVWGLFATLRADTEGRIPLITESQTRIGYGVTLLILVFCLNATISAFRMAFALAD